MMKKVTGFTAVTALTALSASLLFGCGAANSASGGTTAAAYAPAPGAGAGIRYSYENAVPAAAPAGAAAETAALGLADEVAEQEAMAVPSELYINLAQKMDGPETGSDTSAGSGSQTNAGQPERASRKLIRTAYLSVESTEFDALMANIQQTIAALGGYLEESNISGSSISASPHSRRSASMVVRIPSNQLDQFINQVGQQGNITNKSESTQDVTLQYSDVESRKKSLAIEQERIWALLEKADTLEAVIALESRLSDIRYQLESFESQLRLYDNQVDYSTVTLDIEEVRVFTPTSPDSVLTRISKGFGRNLSGVSNGLVDFFVWFVSSIPVLALLGIIITILVLIIRKIAKFTESRPARTAKKQAAKATRKHFWQNRTAPKLDAANAPIPMAQDAQTPAAQGASVPMAQDTQVPIAQGTQAPIAQDTQVPMAQAAPVSMAQGAPDLKMPVSGPQSLETSRSASTTEHPPEP